MVWSRENVTLVVSMGQTAPTWLGSGTIVGRGCILTARHVVFDDDGQEKPGLAVRVEGSADFVPATVTWPGTNEIDVAVLDAKLDQRTTAHPLVVLTVNDIRSGTEWEAQGYPMVREEASSERLEKVRGKACSYKKGEQRLELDVDAAPEKFNGLSGGGVVIAGQVVGVVRAVPHNWNGKRLEATPVGVFLDHSAFRKALGLNAEDEKLANRVQRVVESVTYILEKRHDVVTLLAKRLELIYAAGDGPRVLAAALVTGRKATDVAKILNHVDAELAKKEAPVEDRRVVRNLLWQVLPLAIDWRQLVVMGLGTFTTGQTFLDLPLRSETVAEVVLAGIDDRCCRFAPLVSSGMPVGAAVVRIPAAAQSALFDRDGSRLAELIVQKLAAEVDIQGTYSHYPEMRDAVEGTLRYHASEAPEDELLPYYLLFVDADLRGDTNDHDLWALARARLGEELPSLRLVRLTGGALVEETVLAKHIDAICKRS